MILEKKILTIPCRILIWDLVGKIFEQDLFRYLSEKLEIWPDSGRKFVMITFFASDRSHQISARKLQDLLFSLKNLLISTQKDLIGMKIKKVICKKKNLK